MSESLPRLRSFATEELTSCPSVRSSINYLGPMNAKPVFYAQQVERDNLVLEPHEVDIFDARCLSRGPELESGGFTLVRHPTRFRDFTDPGDVASTYRPEIESLLPALGL